MTNVFELDIIELSKAEKLIKEGNFIDSKEQKDWLEFLINPYLKEVPKMEDVNEEIKKAYEIWQNMNLSEEERDAAERRYKDLLSLEYAKEYEFEQGKKAVAKKMLEENIDISIIEKCTGLTKEEIEKLI